MNTKDIQGADATLNELSALTQAKAELLTWIYSIAGGLIADPAQFEAERQHRVDAFIAAVSASQGQEIARLKAALHEEQEFSKLLKGLREAERAEARLAEQEKEQP